MNVLIACEFSGVVRDAFNKLGHNAWSCDILPSENGGRHFKRPIEEVLSWGLNWDLMICHPPCQYLSSSGLHWNKNNDERKKLTEESLNFVRLLLNSNIKYIALENPVGCISTKIRRPDQIIQPYNFGHDASKKTCLWLKNLPKLVHKEGDYIKPRMVGNKPRWSNQTDSGQNKITPSNDRWKQRSRTYEGIAEAMARQWCNIT